MARTAIGLLLALGVSLLHAREPARFEAAGHLVSARYAHTATLLRDGRVLVAGGIGEYGAVLASAEIFDPATGRFSALRDMPVAKRGHSATLLADGRVLLVGGAGATRDADAALLFDPLGDRFETAGKLVTPQFGHAAARLRDGRVLIIGGLKSSTSLGVTAATPEIFDPATGRFSAGPGSVVTNSLYPDAGAPLWVTATTLADGRVLVIGSVTSESLDADAMAFTAAGILRDPALPFGSYWHASTLLGDGSVLVTGGTDEYRFSAGAQRFDPATGDFSLVGGMSARRALHTATRLQDGRVLVTGGETTIDSGGYTYFGGTLASSDVFDPASGAFRPGPAMAVPRSGHTATLLHDGRVLVVGGMGYFAFPSPLHPDLLGSAEMYVDDASACVKARQPARCRPK